MRADYVAYKTWLQKPESLRKLAASTKQFTTWCQETETTSPDGVTECSCQPMFSCPQAHNSVQDQSGSVLATTRLHLGRCKALQLTASLGEVERGQKAKRLNPFRTSSKKQLHSTRTDVIKFKRGQPQVSKSNLGGEVGEQRRPGARREFSCCVFGPTRWALRQATL
jgi:hypothetical protein